MPSSEESEKVVYRPYLSQAKEPPVVVETSANAAALLEAMFNTVPLALPLKTVYQEFPALQKVIAKRDVNFETREEVLTITPPFGKALTCVEVIVQKKRVKAVIDNGSPVNFVLSK